MTRSRYNHATNVDRVWGLRQDRSKLIEKVRQAVESRKPKAEILRLLDELAALNRTI